MKSKMKLLILALLVSVNAWSIGAAYNVLDYGAKNDSTGRSEDGINAAIQAAKAAGGGTVYIPAGDYICGPIKLVSNLVLHIEAGAVLHFPAQDYPFMKSRNQGIECLTSIPLIGGEYLENVTITGRGTITTSNAEWMKLKPRHKGISAAGPNWANLLKALESTTPASDELYQKAAPELRPAFILFKDSKNVIIEGIHIVGSAMWPIHLLYSENVVVQNVFVNTFPGVHTGGIYLDSSSYIRISNCFIETGDDGIVIKSGKDADGIRVNKPTEHVTITNCTVREAHGAVTIGSEIGGGIRNIVASNIVCKNTDIGVRIKSRRGRGGYIEDVRFDNWTMEDMGQAINITNFYAMEGEVISAEAQVANDRTPRFKNIAISNMTINRARVCINIDGLPEMPIEGVRISDVIASGEIGMKASNALALELINVQVNANNGPAFLVHDSKDLELSGVSTRKPVANMPIIRLDNCPGAIVRNSKAADGTDTFLSVGPGELKDITQIGNVTNKAKKATSEVKVDYWTQEPCTEPSQEPKNQ